LLKESLVSKTRAIATRDVLYGGTCLLLLLAGCSFGLSKSDETGEIDTWRMPELSSDQDGDGVTVDDVYWDDENADIRPGVEEECNGIDDNCNDIIDEGMEDSDGDGIGDCVDEEECDGLDNDGDGFVDEDYGDGDGDGTADCVDAEECDGIDNDGDGEIDEGYDADGDGYTQCGNLVTGAYDCDDSDDEIYPGAFEVDSDGVDNDCDDRIDETLYRTGALIVNELMTNPQRVSDANGEWFEVYNATFSTLYLNGLELETESATYVVEEEVPVALPSGAYFVFGLNDDLNQNGDVSVNLVYQELSLSNESGELTLAMEGSVVDSVSWDDGATMPDVHGASMSLDIVLLDATLNDDAASWCASTEEWELGADFGSPGTPNELCADIDHDGDGYVAADGDCDDTDDTVYPGAPEIDPGVDNDCDGVVESIPVAVADYDSSSSLETCDDLILDGSGSYDSDGDALTYEWALTAIPGSSGRSTDDIRETTDISPAFSPDVAGNYTFELIVNDGSGDSDPDYLAVDILERVTNNSPSANAGVDTSVSNTSSCTMYTCPDCGGLTLTLNGTASSDPDGDALDYSWSVTSGSSYGTLLDTTAESPDLEFDSLSATKGSTNSASISLELTVSDCQGETSTDSVTVTFSCTGS
jgi:hypothetical protein